MANAIANEGTRWKTGVGRLVWGHPGKMQQAKDFFTKQPKLGKDGKPYDECAFGVAFPKAEFNVHSWPYMEAEARKAFPGGVPAGFAWKLIDGDGRDKQGKPYAEREGYAGCWVLTFRNGFSVNTYKRNPQTGGYDQLTPEQMKTGDYIVVGAHAVVNPGPANPSLYLNPQAVELIGVGTEIVSRGAVDPNQVFGGQTYQLPPGATAPGTAPPMPQHGGNAPGMPGQAPMPGGYQQPAPQPGYPPQQPPMQQYQPAPQGYPAPGPAPGGYAPQPGYPPQQQLPPPAHDFIPGGYAPPPQTPGYPPQQQMPAPQGYPQPAPGPQQYAPQPAPGAYPGAPPPR